MRKLNKIKSAQILCQLLHRGQKRKYTNEPYYCHPFRVAKTIQRAGFGHEAIIAAYLHDTVEDTEFTSDNVYQFFGPNVRDFVAGVTDISQPGDGNRAIRKKMDRTHLGLQGKVAQSIKLADLYDNTKSIVRHDPDFAQLYLQEKEELLSVLVKGHKGLYKMCEDQLLKSKEELRLLL